MYFDEFDVFDIQAVKLFPDGEGMAAESGFTSFFMWKDVINPRYSIIDGVFCLFCEPREEAPFVSIFKKDMEEREFTAVVGKLGAIFAHKGLNLRLGYLPERLLAFLDKLEGVSYEVSYDRRYSDYIYGSNDFLSLDGGRHKSRRYDFNFFLKHYSPQIQIMEKSNTAQCMEFMEEINCRRKSCSQCGYGCEMEALKILTANFNELGLNGMFVKSGGRTAAFVIGEKAAGDMFLYHFLKADKSMRGLTVFLLHEFGIIFHSGAEYVNYSEDMGYAGLREYKMKMKPAMMVHKYFVNIMPLIK